MRAYVALLLLLPVGAALAGCEVQNAARANADLPPSETIPAGTHCLVELQRNALGAGSSSPISAKLKEFNGAVLSYEGKMKRMNSDWVVLTLDDNSECWIAKGAVLTITVPPSATPR